MPLLARTDAERAHRLAILALRLGLAGRDTAAGRPGVAGAGDGPALPQPDRPRRRVRQGRPGAARPAPAGLRPGRGRDRHAAPAARQPAPARVPPGEDAAVINRYGFNNRGIAAFLARLAALPRPRTAAASRSAPTSASTRRVPTPSATCPPWPPPSRRTPTTSWSTCPPPTRPACATCKGRRAWPPSWPPCNAAVPHRPPLLVKIAPDLPEGGLEAVVETAIRHGVDGLIVSNTTIARPDTLRSPPCAGGWRPVRPPAARRQHAAAGAGVPPGGGAAGAGRLRRRRHRGGRAGQDPGGRAPGAALHRIRLAGPGLVPRIKRELSAALRQQGFANVQDAVGVDA